MENKISMLNNPDRISQQLIRFNQFKEPINSILSKYEEEYNITIFYSSEVGSRGLGTDVEDSDFDVTGFFHPRNELEYYKIIRKFDKTIKITQEIIMINEKTYEIDIELWDIKEWLRSKVTKNLSGCDFWFNSHLIYKNIYPEIVESMQKYIVPPSLVYWGKAKSGMGYNIKDIKNKGHCFNKSLMNVLTSLFQYLHYQIYLNFPQFNILEELDYLIKEKNNIIKGEYFNEEEFILFEKSVNLYLHLFEEKKKDRKSFREKIPQNIHDFLHLLEKKYNTHRKKYELEILIKEEDAQNIFDEIMKRNF